MASYNFAKALLTPVKVTTAIAGTAAKVTAGTANTVADVLGMRPALWVPAPQPAPRPARKAGLFPKPRPW